jgi:hypothetical protein
MPTDPTPAALPGDPVEPFYPDGCVYGHADDGIEGSVRDAAITSRAAAQRHFAGILGVAFNDVRVRTTYGCALTRQDVWDDHARDDAEDQRREELGLTLKYDRALKGLAAFWYEDATGRVVEEAEWEIPEPPPDWEPKGEDPVWRECKKDDPGAVKIYICEAKDG